MKKRVKKNKRLRKAETDVINKNKRKNEKQKDARAENSNCDFMCSYVDYSLWQDCEQLLIEMML